MNTNTNNTNEQGRAWIAATLNPDADVYTVRKLTARAAKRCALLSTAVESTHGAWRCTRYVSNDDDHRCIYHAAKSATQQLWFVVEATA